MTRPVGMAGTGYVVVELTTLGPLLLTPSPVTLQEAVALTRGEARYTRRVRWVGDDLAKIVTPHQLTHPTPS